MTSTHTTQLYFSEITKSFSRKQVLCNTELLINRGECILLCGNNGSGKTTLLRIIAGIEVPDSAFVHTDAGKFSWKKYRRHLANSVVYLHQQPYMFDGNVISNLSFSLQKNLTKQQRSTRINAAIEWAGLENIAYDSAKTLSGGECQRVAIARAWIRDPDILLLDEPITNMDQDARSRTIQLLLSLKQQGVALVVSSHEPVHFDTLTDTSLHISEGQLHDFSTIDNIIPIHYRKLNYDQSR